MIPFWQSVHKCYEKDGVEFEKFRLLNNSLWLVGWLAKIKTLVMTFCLFLFLVIHSLLCFCIFIKRQRSDMREKGSLQVRCCFSVQCWKVWVKLGKCKDKTVKYLFLNRRRKIQQKNKTTSKRQFISICYFWCDLNTSEKRFSMLIGTPHQTARNILFKHLEESNKGENISFVFHIIVRPTNFGFLHSQ